MASEQKRVEWEALDYAFRACVALRDRDLPQAVYGFILAAIRTADLDTDGKALDALQSALAETKRAGGRQ